jgi:tetratricopeptide (TPR) repeat protein
MLPIATPPPLRVIKFASPVRRWLLLLPVGLALLGSFFTIRWCAGDTLAHAANNPDLAEFALRLAPTDPQSHYALGKIAESSFEPGAQDLAVREYEAAVRLAPEDYRLWMILAAARERNGDATKAGVAYLEAERLAPAYSMPQWAAGNFLLRQGRAGEAIPRLMKAGESMERLRRPVLELVSSYYEFHIPELIRQIGPRPELRQGLFQLMLDHHWPSDALEVWEHFAPSERAALVPLGNRLVAALVDDLQFEQARKLQNELSPGINTQANEIENRSFEADVTTDGTNLFGWRVGAGFQPQIALDSGQSHPLGRALLLAFERSDNVPLRHVTQLVVVDSKRRYRLTYFVRAADVRGTAGIRVQILDAANQIVLAQSEPLPPGASEWHAESLDFTVPDTRTGIMIRLGAVTCTAETCPVFGRVWYDDFELKRND